MMLIQLNAILIPLTNMWKGSLGLSGHICMFHKDIMSVVNELPQKNVEMLNMLRDIESKDNPERYLDKSSKFGEQKSSKHSDGSRNTISAIGTLLLLKIIFLG